MAETKKETFQLQGGQVLDKIRQLVHEGNVRQITVKQHGKTVAEFPLTVGVVGTIFAPILAAIGALAALLAECTIEVERIEEAPAKGHKAVARKTAEEKELAPVS
ncbi:MAG TPA: DUF4342 domain-containing protein [Dehalococcoidia bacterium]|nr:DUF4342 domain-containing protein [Dehalococcoidia bacterium]